MCLFRAKTQSRNYHLKNSPRSQRYVFLHKQHRVSRWSRFLNVGGVSLIYRLALEGARLAYCGVCG